MLKVVNADTEANILVTGGTGSECWYSAEDVYKTFTRSVTIPAGTPHIQIRVWCGQHNGDVFLTILW